MSKKLIQKPKLKASSNLFYGHTFKLVLEQIIEKITDLEFNKYPSLNIDFVFNSTPKENNNFLELHFKLTYIGQINLFEKLIKEVSQETILPFHALEFNEETRIAKVIYRLQNQTKNKNLDFLSSDSLKTYQSSFKVPLGIDVINGQQYFIDFDNMQEGHIAIAGKTGTGKSRLIKHILYYLIKHNHPKDLSIMIFDPCTIQYAEFEKLSNGKVNPYFLDFSVSNNFTQEQIIQGLHIPSYIKQVNSIIKKRKEMMIRAGCNDVISYNHRCPNKKLSKLIIILEEYKSTNKSINERIADEYKNFAFQLSTLGRQNNIKAIYCSQDPDDINQISGQCTNFIAYDIKDKSKYKEFLDFRPSAYYPTSSQVAHIKLDDIEASIKTASITNNHTDSLHLNKLLSQKRF
jgi:FtsK/SpoIIIE family